ncbi:14447_t:CDS:2 [Acaulospora morrowiae]|uniref:14447_t:CDS:1 n=1 Tax=Acaulospora morrowiae TaxID=94023 RepID=A0A9N9CPP6_9GLOM|nr:14447_t:CDS:2 [Acaulospora morrowiae]
MRIENTHGCHPAGTGCDDRSNYKCGAQVVDANLLPNSIIELTLESPNYHDNLGVSAIGHFSMHVDNKEGHGGGYSFFSDPIWVNGCDCDNCQNIPLSFKYTRDFDMPTPPKGTWFDVWISIYWSCGSMHELNPRAIACNSQDVHYRTYVK